MRKIGVIGTRKRNSREDYNLTQLQFFKVYEEDDWIISGGCPQGGDAFAEKIARDYGIPILIFYPKRRKVQEFFARNTLIAIHSDILLACLVNPEQSLRQVFLRKQGGAEDTLKKFMKDKFKREGKRKFNDIVYIV